MKINFGGVIGDLHETFRMPKKDAKATFGRKDKYLPAEASGPASGQQL
jgi:hypothetical protein